MVYWLYAKLTIIHQSLSLREIKSLQTSQVSYGNAVSWGLVPGAKTPRLGVWYWTPRQSNEGCLRVRQYIFYVLVCVGMGFMYWIREILFLNGKITFNV